MAMFPQNDDFKIESTVGIRSHGAEPRSDELGFHKMELMLGVAGFLALIVLVAVLRVCCCDLPAPPRASSRLARNRDHPRSPASPFFNTTTQLTDSTMTLWPASTAMYYRQDEPHPLATRASLRPSSAMFPAGIGASSPYGQPLTRSILNDLPPTYEQAMRSSHKELPTN